MRTILGAFFGLLFGVLAIVSQETLSFHRYVSYWRGVPAVVMGIGWLGLAVTSVLKSEAAAWLAKHGKLEAEPK